MAVGAAGGLRIPNALYEVMTHFVIRGRTIEDSVAAPRMHTTGTVELTVEREYPEQTVDYLKQIGFEVKPGPTALVSAVYREPKSGETRAALR